MKTLDQVVIEAETIMAAHAEGAEMDAGFDAGEWSGPAHDEMMEQEIKELAEANGFTYDQVDDELMKRANEELDRIAEQGLRDLEPPSDGETEQHVTNGYETSDNQEISGLREVIADLNRQNELLRRGQDKTLDQRNTDHVGEFFKLINFVSNDRRLREEFNRVLSREHRHLQGEAIKVMYEIMFEYAKTPDSYTDARNKWAVDLARKVRDCR